MILNEEAVKRAVNVGVAKALLLEKRDEDVTYEMVVDGPHKFVIGDPSYVLSDDNYFNVLLKKRSGVVKGKIGMFHGTYVGDGDYESKTGQRYGVDAGMIGIIDKEFCEKNDGQMADYRLNKEFSVDGDGKHRISMRYKDGTFTFSFDGKVVEKVITK